MPLISSFLNLILLLSFFPSLFTATQQNIRVAIVGAGIGGASLSHYLAEKSQFFSEITIFEKTDSAGGRTNHYSLSEDQQIETGASFFIDVNKNLLNLAQLYNCSYSGGTQKEIFGLWNEKEWVFESSSRSYLTSLKMFWKYGLSPLYFLTENAKMIEDFLKVYENDSVAFSNYSEFLHLVKAQKFMSITLEEHLRNQNYNLDFIKEFVGGIISGIYNQKFSQINAFAGMIALAGANNKAYHFDGGNRQCIKNIIEKNQAVLLKLNSKVTRITRKEGLFAIKYQDEEGKEREEDFNIVVVATPIHNLKIDTNNTSIKIMKSPSVKAYIYLVSGQLKCSYFHASQESDCPGTALNIFPTNSKLADYSRKCRDCHTIEKQKYDVYKFQATQKLSNEELVQMFEGGVYETLDHKEWEAYPFLAPLSESEFFDIKIEDGLYYLNGMENLASCMEMETISAKNIAKLIWSEITGVLETKKASEVSEIRNETNTTQEEKTKIHSDF